MLLRETSVRRTADSAWHGMGRRKAPRVTPDSGPDGVRFTSVLDLTTLGLSVALPVSIYVLTGQMVKDVSGPSLLLSALVAALAAGLSGICYSELRCRWPRILGDAYDYNYFSIGEAAGFMVGWFTILQYISCTCALSRSISQNFDSLLNFRILNLTSSHVGEISSLGSTPDFLAGFIVILYMAVVSVGYRQPFKISIIVIVSTIFITLFALVAGVFHLNFDNWVPDSKFFPDGVNGIMKGAAGLFYAFTCFQLIVDRTDFLGHSGKRPVISTAISYVICLFFVMSITCVMTLITPLSSLQTEAVWTETFCRAGMDWMRFILGTGAILALMSAMWIVMAHASTFVAKMADDGLLFECLLWTNREGDSPMLPTILIGLLSVMFAIVFGLRNLIDVLGAASLVICIFACIAALYIRYKPPLSLSSVSHHRQSRKKRRRNNNTVNGRLSEAGVSYGATGSDNNPLSPGGSPVHIPEDEMVDMNGYNPNGHIPSQVSDPESEDDIDDIVEEYKEKLRVRALTSCGVPGDDIHIPTEGTHRKACLSVASFVIWMLLVSALACHASQQIKDGSVILILLLVVFLILTLVSAGVLLRQPMDILDLEDLAIAIPSVPWIPLIALVLDVHLLMRFDGTTWLQIFIWWLIGVFLYYTYGIRRSQAGHRYDLLPDEHCGLLPPSPDHAPQGAPPVAIIPQTGPSTSGAGYQQVQLQTDDPLLLE